MSDAIPPDSGRVPSRGRVRILAIETSCDETGIALLESDEPIGQRVPRIVVNLVASQGVLHERFGGIVPEIAAREHQRQLLPLIDEALTRACWALHDLDAIAVATRPGLVGSLIVGLSGAKGLCMALGVPLIAYDHLEGHLYACQFAHPDRPLWPCLGLVVSGGHTSLFHCRGPLEYELLGGTLDDAAGEAFDKVASLLGLGYPGGPLIERAAQGGNARAYRFPRAFLHEPRLAFSFSGLKTAVLYVVRGQDARQQSSDNALSDQTIRDLAASFQEAVVDVLAAKVEQALDQTGLDRLAVGGGVAANGALRGRLERLAERRGAGLFIPPLDLCTDNAGLGAIAFARLAAGQVADLDIDVVAGLVRPGKG